nr:MAG TPA: hypothetical protein [Caudoviricetes sp.]
MQLYEPVKSLVVFHFLLSPFVTFPGAILSSQAPARAEYQERR